MRTKRLLALSLGALTAVTLQAGPSTAAESSGTPTRVPTFTPVGPLDSNVLSMSSDGRVLVGTDIFGGGAFRWTRQHGTQQLGNAGGQVSISRDGSTIVGDVFRKHTTAAMWRGGTRWRSLGSYPGSEGCPDLSNAYAVSDGGSTVVGLGWDGCKATAFRWRKATGLKSLGSLDGMASRANDVSADGSVIVGWDDAPDGSRRGARWMHGTESLLSPFGPFLGSAEAVTPDGRVVVGQNAGRGDVRRQAYRWTESRGARLLGKLPGGGILGSAAAFGVTNNGKVVVGFSGARRRDAFVWTNATGMFKLQDYLEGLGVTGLEGWRLDTALAISGDGTTIAGWGYRPDGHVQGWRVTNLPPFTA
jgi:probable HAF family extracellular repeat protein